MVQIEISPQLLDGLMKFCADIHGPQKMNPNGFGDPNGFGVSLSATMRSIFVVLSEKSC